MAKYDYSNRLNSLKTRRNDREDLLKAAGIYQIMTDSYEQLKESESIKYVIGAMKPVDLKYTQKTISEGERVKAHLQKLREIGHNVDFRYQGSVTNNTHIKAHSDIDILTIYLNFINLEPPQKVTSPYKGNPVEELCKLREDSYSILRSAFHAADVDNNGAKSISLQGGSLSRKVDVVPSNWFDTVKYKETGLEYFRGVMVLDYHRKRQLANTPFYHNKLLDDKDTNSFNNYKKVVRLLKTLKADADSTINLSSYDIAALMYHMNNTDYYVGKSPLLLIKKSLDFLNFVHKNEVYRNNLYVPDNSRTVFQNGRSANDSLELLIIELDNIYQDLLADLKMSGNGIDKQIIA